MKIFFISFSLGLILFSIFIFSGKEGEALSKQVKKTYSIKKENKQLKSPKPFMKNEKAGSNKATFDNQEKQDKEDRELNFKENEKKNKWANPTYKKIIQDKLILLTSPWTQGNKKVFKSIDHNNILNQGSGKFIEARGVFAIPVSQIENLDSDIIPLQKISGYILVGVKEGGEFSPPSKGKKVLFNGVNDTFSITTGSLKIYFKNWPYPKHLLQKYNIKGQSLLAELKMGIFTHELSALKDIMKLIDELNKEEGISLVELEILLPSVQPH